MEADLVDLLDSRQGPIEKDKKWTCFSLTSDLDVEQLYTELHAFFEVGDKDRYLSVACIGGASWALLCKLDSHKIAKMPNCVSGVYDIAGNAKWGILAFGKKWFKGASILVANFKLDQTEANHEE